MHPSAINVSAKQRVFPIECNVHHIVYVAASCEPGHLSAWPSRSWFTNAGDGSETSAHMVQGAHRGTVHRSGVCVGPNDLQGLQVYDFGSLVF